MMDIRPLRSDSDHQDALRRSEALWGAPVGSWEGDELDILTTLVEAYEEANFRFPAAEPVAVIRAVMDEHGYSQADLGQVLGSRSRASEILNRKRALSTEHIRAIRRAWRVPADALIEG